MSLWNTTFKIIKGSNEVLKIILLQDSILCRTLKHWTQRIVFRLRYTPHPLNCHSGHCQQRHSRRLPWAPDSRDTKQGGMREWEHTVQRKRLKAGRRKWKGSRGQVMVIEWGGNTENFQVRNWPQRSLGRICSHHHLTKKMLLGDAWRMKTRFLLF